MLYDQKKTALRKKTTCTCVLLSLPAEVADRRVREYDLLFVRHVDGPEVRTVRCRVAILPELRMDVTQKSLEELYMSVRTNVKPIVTIE